jgi:hypothetical protein
MSPHTGNGPPKEDRPPENRKPINSLCSHHATPTGNDGTAVARRLRLRRAASYRLPVLESARSDPWHYDASGIGGYEAATAHLLEVGLTPAPDLDGLRVMRRRGGRHRRTAETITERWGLAK